MIRVALSVFMIVLFFPLLLFAQDVTPTMPDTSSFFDAIGDKHWPLAAALGLTILVWFVRYVLKDKFPAKYVPYVTVVCTVIGAIAAGIIQAIDANSAWWHGLLNGLFSGLTIALPSLGIWSAGAKNVLKLPKEVKKE